jgi:hypothetical protein
VGEGIVTHFDKLNRDRVERVLNLLTEAPFFFRADDEDSFFYLRRHRAEFVRFFADSFGWELLVDARAARLFKPRWYNDALRPSQRDVFELGRRNDCIGFLLVLEFYEHLLDEQNVAADDPEPPRFHFGSLFRFSVERFREELGEAAPDEEAVRRILRALVPTLLRYRFLRELEPPRGAEVDQDGRIYECTPALALYDVRALGPRALADFARAGQGGPAVESEEEAAP